jgi:predicted PurR-regulated permease PerM
MRFDLKCIFYIISIIVLGIITGIILIFTMFNQDTNIYVKSIDRSIEFTLGEVKVESINIRINNVENKTTFTVKDIDAFEQLIYDNPYYIDAYTYNDSTVHLFLIPILSYYTIKNLGISYQQMSH